MAYLLEIDNEKNLMTITYDQTSTYADRTHVLDEVISHLKDDPTTNILIDARAAENTLTTEEQIEFGKILGNNSMYFRENKTAVLKSKSLHPVVLAEAFMNGHSHLVEFESRKEACQWLLGALR